MNAPQPQGHINQGPPTDASYSAHESVRHFAEPATVMMLSYIGGLTVMDTAIAAAISDRSSFETETRARTLGTARSAIKLVLGNREESLATAQRLYAMHTTINGVHEGVPYDANDMEAQAWVALSVFSGMEQAASRWARPFGEDRERAYQGVRINFAQSFGINPSIMPRTARDYDDYVDERIESGVLLASPASQDMSQKIFRLKSDQIPTPITNIMQAVALTSLDPRLQEQADLKPEPRDIRIAHNFDRVMRNSYGRIPATARKGFAPALLAARRRFA